ncbi:bifunctional lysylphosphatidylglycerol flippase/synthetase MprF [Kutzneria sp. NPDC052558]|uniref:bifunctional lysylphosphatidylglycerol flippase/synthetase MprF n=1 Tax=Kutzneria sp. NPDC052558 TaxID=3364121 RepID=UPI0037C795C6
MTTLASWRRNAAHALVALRRAPFTIGLVGLLWLTAIVTGSLPGGPPDNLYDVVAVSWDDFAAGNLWTVVTNGMWCFDLTGYLLTTLLLLVIGVPAERRLGPRRSMLVLAASQVLAVLVAIPAVRLVALTGEPWTASIVHDTSLGLSPGVAGLGLALSCRLGALWRRRLRLFVLVGASVLVLYSGTMQDVVRLAGGIAGLVIGLALLNRPPRVAMNAPSRSETKVLVAMLVAATALGPIATLFSKSAAGPLGLLEIMFASPAVGADSVAEACANGAQDTAQCRLVTSETLGTGIGSAVTSIAPALLLLAVAEGLRRGRRFAWWLALLFNAMLGLSCVVFIGGYLYFSESSLNDVIPNIPPMLLPFAVCGLLLVTRDVFTVTAPQRTYRRLAAGLLGTFLATSAVYVGVGYLDRAHFKPVPDLGGLLGDLPSRYLPPGYILLADIDFLPTGGLAGLVWEYTGAVFWVVLLIGLLVSFWRAKPVQDADATVVARKLMERNANSSLAYMTTWPGNQYWFTPLRQAALAYRVSATVALTTGGPIGDPGLHREVVVGFQEFCADNGWTPCLYSITADVRDAAVALGWQTVQVAEDTVVPLADLEFTGKKWQDVRTALNKAGKEGITAEWLSYPDAPLAITDQVRAISEEWVADKGMPEMGFTLGGLDELADRSVRCLVAVDRDRTVHGVTSWLPVYENDEPVGWTLDFMRRRGAGFRGVTEFMIASAALTLKEEGARFLSLSGAPLARLDRGEEVSSLQRILDVTGKALEPVYGFRSLLSFKAKFQPEYRPLFMAYPDSGALPAIGNAIGRAYLPDLTARQGLRLVSKLFRK